MHLTQKFPARDNEYRLKVESGEMQPIEACVAILNKTSLSSATPGVQVDSSDEEQVELINTFHRLHYSWFSNRYYPEIQDYYIRNIGNVFDASNPALYMTRALLDSSYSFDKIFTEALRLEVFVKHIVRQVVLSIFLLVQVIMISFKGLSMQEEAVS